MGVAAGRAALLASVVALVFATAADARTDSVHVRAVAGNKGPSSAYLTTEVTLAQRAFVGTVLNEGTLTSCPSDYAAATASPGAMIVSAGFEEQSEGSVGLATGLQVLVPGGTWTLCGWVQPGGEGAGVSASASGGPTVFTVAGPEGTTSVPVPSVYGQEQPVTVSVGYTLVESAGQIPGATQVALHVAAAPAGHPCNEGIPLAVDQAGPPVLAALVNAPASGSQSYTGHLAPGAYSLCGWLEQNLSEIGVGLIPGLVPHAFGTSMQPLIVLPRPAVSHLGATVKRGAARHASVVARYALNEAGTVTVVLKRVVPARHPFSGESCVRNPERAHRELCGAARTVATERMDASSGEDTTRVPIAHALARGVYVLSVSAESAPHEVSPAASTVFAVR